MRVRILIAALACLLAGFTACGGGDDGGEAGGGDDGGAEAAAPADDQKTVDRVVLQQSDFPDGWTAEKPPADQQQDEGGAFQDCFQDQTQTLEESTTASADSPQFRAGQTISVFSSAFAFKTEQDAKDAFALARSDEAQGCIEDGAKLQFAAQAGEGAQAGDAQVTEHPAPAVGDERLGLRLVLQGQAQNQGVTVNVDLLFIRTGRLFSILRFQNIGKPVPDSEQKILAESVSKRMKSSE
jgi:hypothetical protein